jgi:hypothetical protein
MQKHRSRQLIQNRVTKVDLRISQRDDIAAHSTFTYVLNESVLHNLRFALIWDSLRPEVDDAHEDQADSQEIKFMSFSKIKPIATNFAFLIKIGSRLVQLYDITSKLVSVSDGVDCDSDSKSECGILDKNTDLVTENSQIILIPRNDVKKRLQK